jgi:hypothetical protein
VWSLAFAIVVIIFLSLALTIVLVLGNKVPCLRMCITQSGGQNDCRSSPSYSDQATAHTHPVDPYNRNVHRDIDEETQIRKQIMGGFVAGNFDKHLRQISKQV